MKLTVISKTNHIFYILDGDVSKAFEDAVKAAGLTLADIETDPTTPEEEVDKP